MSALGWRKKPELDMDAYVKDVAVNLEVIMRLLKLSHIVCYHEDGAPPVAIARQAIDELVEKVKKREGK